MYIMYTNTNGLLFLLGCSPLSMMMHVYIFILCYVKKTRTGHLKYSAIQCHRCTISYCCMSIDIDRRCQGIQVLLRNPAC